MTTAPHVADVVSATITQKVQALPPVVAPTYELAQSRPAPLPCAAAQPQGTSVTLSPAIAGLLNNRLAIVALLAVVGPLGLPALWLSPRFSRITKTVTTVLFLLITVVLPLVMTYYWVEIALRPLVDACGQVLN